MPAPFDYSDVSKRAERQADELRKADSYSDDTWRHPVLGPIVRVYAFLTHRASEAFDEPTTAEYIAECRTYAYVFFACVYDGLAEVATADDGFIDLVTEYDALVDADLMGVMEGAKSDAKDRLAQLTGSNQGALPKRPGTLHKRRRTAGDS